MSVLFDDFDDSVINPAKWTTNLTATGRAIIEQSGRLEFNYTSNPPGTFYVDSVPTFNLTNDNVSTQLVAYPAVSAYFQFYMLDALGNGVGIRLTNTIAQARSLVLGVPTTHASTAWAIGTNPYIRVRNSSSKIIFDTSTDNSSWSAITTITNPVDLDLTTLRLRIGQLASDATGLIAIDNVYAPALPSVVKPYLF